MTISIDVIRVEKIARFLGRYYAVLDPSEGWERIPAEVAKDVMAGNNIIPVVTLIKEEDQVFRLVVFQFSSGDWTAFQLHGFLHPTNPKIVWEARDVEGDDLKVVSH